MNHAVVGNYPENIPIQLFDRFNLFDPAFERLLFQRLLVANPDNIFQRGISAINCFFSGFGVDHARNIGDVNTKIIQERTILPEWIAICLIIHRYFLVAKKKNDSFTYKLLQALSSLNIYFCGKHG